MSKLLATIALLFSMCAAHASRVSVMVFIKEQHLAQRQAPDPAVETAVIRTLIEEGFKVVDPKRVAELKEQEALDRILTKGKNWQADVKRILQKVGADVMVVGEAFTELVQRRNEETDLGQVTIFRCRGRLEVRAIKSSTAEIVFTDSEQATGPAEMTELLASKAALEDLGVRISPKLVTKLDKLKGTGMRVQIEIRGVERATDAEKFKKALASIAGVTGVSDPDMEGRNLTFELTLSSITATTLAARLEQHASLKAYKLQSQSIAKDKIVLNVRARG